MKRCLAGEVSTTRETLINRICQRAAGSQIKTISVEIDMMKIENNDTNVVKIVDTGDGYEVRVTDGKAVFGRVTVIDLGEEGALIQFSGNANNGQSEEYLKYFCSKDARWCDQHNGYVIPGRRGLRASLRWAHRNYLQGRADDENGPNPLETEF